MKKDIKTIVNETFSKFPTVDTVYSTSDGNVFIEENRAQVHAGKDGKYFTHQRGPEVDQTTPQRGSKELIAEIKEVKTLEDLEQYVANENRATVLAAIEKRKTEIQKDVPTVQNGTQSENPNTQK